MPLWRKLHALRRGVRASLGSSIDAALALWYDFTAPEWNGGTGQIDATSAIGPSLDFTRATTASVSDYFNVLKTVNSGEPRFTGGRRVENLQVQSETFDNASWTKSRATITANQVANPIDGTVDADQLIEDATASNSHRVYSGRTGDDRGKTFSVYAKNVDRDWIYLRFTILGGGYGFAYFNLNTGAKGTVSGFGVTSRIEDVGSGWYRCSLTTQGEVIGTQNSLIGLANADNSDSYSGDGAKSVYIYGAQVEDVTGQDDTAPSEYIATTTAAVSKWYATKRRTNLVPQSNDIAEAAEWSLVRGVAVDGIAGGVSGITTTHGSLTSATGGGSDSTRLTTSTITVPAQTTHTCSFYAKASGVSWVRMLILSDGSNSVGAYFHLSGAGAVGATPGVNNDSESITSVGDGWYRCSITWTTDDGIFTFSARLADADTDDQVLQDGSASALFSGFQLERGSTATAYITTTTTVASSTFDTAITPTGLLVEEARTNVNTYSEDASSWSHNNSITVDSNAATAPDGTLTADRMNVSVASAWHGARNYNAGGHGTPSTWSVYVKNDGADYVGLTRLTASEQFETVVFNLLTGTETLQDVGTTSGTIDASGIEDVGNGWFRLYMTVSAVDSGYYGILLFSQASPTLDASGREVFLGVDGNDLLIWGAQLEAGAFPTSYIGPTTTASVTRNAEDNIHVINDAEAAAALNDSAGTLYVDFSPIPTSLPAQNVFMVSGGDTITNGQTVYVSLDDLTFRGRQNTVDQYQIYIQNGVAANVSQKAAGAYAENDAMAYHNGTAGTPDTTVGTPIGLDSIHVATRGFTNNASSLHIAEIRYYNERKSDADLQQLSTNGELT